MYEVSRDIRQLGNSVVVITSGQLLEISGYIKTIIDWFRAWGSRDIDVVESVYTLNLVRAE